MERGIRLVHAKYYSPGIPMIPGGVTLDIPTFTQVPIAGADQLLIAANPQRKGLIFANPSATAILYIVPQPLTGSAVTAAVNTGIALPALGGFIQIDTLKCSCAWRVFASAAGTCSVLEWI
jgi:hypothetical protein